MAQQSAMMNELLQPIILPLTSICVVPVDPVVVVVVLGSADVYSIVDVIVSCDTIKHNFQGWLLLSIALLQCHN